MRLARLPLLIAALLTVTTPIAHAEKKDRKGSTAQTTGGAGQAEADAIVDRMSKAEGALLERLRTSHPLMEVYLQNVAPDEARGWVPTGDDYFLGQLQFDDGPSLRAFGQREPKKPGSGVKVNLLSDVPSVGNAFAATVAPDWQALDRKRYEFTYVRREFLGESRCFVFDVRPLRKSGQGFVGRIWIEDRDYNLVRFNGAIGESDRTLSGLLKRTLSFHMDGWRVNAAPGVWVPSYVYSEETDLSTASSSKSSY